MSPLTLRLSKEEWSRLHIIVIALPTKFVFLHLVDLGQYAPHHIRHHLLTPDADVGDGALDLHEVRLEFIRVHYRDDLHPELVAVAEPDDDLPTLEDSGGLVDMDGGCGTLNQTLGVRCYLATAVTHQYICVDIQSCHLGFWWRRWRRRWAGTIVFLNIGQNKLHIGQ